MAIKKLNLHHDSVEHKEKKLDWYWAPIYCAIWFLLFYAVAIPSFYNYPKTLLMRNEHQHPDEFIGERAELQLLTLSRFGVKLSGTIENEVLAVNFLLGEIDKIKAQARLDLYDIAVELQYASGQFQLWGMATSYHNVSNVVVKLAPRNVTTASYLLVNAHFDSEAHSPAAGDDGVMIVIMLETLRVISKAEQPLMHPIVFLFNGAEESNLLASHAFITRHKWAQYCKALINLDSAGSGGREILFQSGPNHPWLMKYYKQSVPRPFATTIAEELFQNNFVPSDTDFRIFREYGRVPGLDMAHALNGYVYHTKYDSYANLERRTCQTTGENVLALTWALANAPELENPENYAEGHTVFYDYLGWFVIFYTEQTGVIINITTSVCAVFIICISVYLMSRDDGADTIKQVFIRFSTIVGVQIVTTLVAGGLTFLIAVAIDGIGASECWYSETWLIFGLYFCPMFFAMTLLPAVYMHCTKERSNMRPDDTLACFMHSHCLILVLICLTMTGLGIRSAFFPMIAIFFYTMSVILSVGNRLWGKKYLYLPIHLLCQLAPYWFYTYLTFTFLTIFIPMQGRNGPTSRPEFLIAGLCVIMAIHFSGFILPVLHKFRKSKTFISLFGVTCLVFIMIACLPVGFPYKKDVAAQRVYVLHTTRTFYNEYGFVYRNESGYYVQPVDRRINTLENIIFQNAEPKSAIEADCAAEIFCGLPLYNSRWLNWKNSSRWILASSPSLPIPTQLKLTSKVYITNRRVRYGFSLKSADRVVIYIDPYPDAKVVDWTFDKTPLKNNYSTPYFIYHMYSMTESPLQFWIEVDRHAAANESAALRLGIGAHFQYHESYYTDEFKAFLKRFPEWSYPIHWSASFESRIF
ncbi:PREDICTED: endoplasmic reticulum metallopeptidase 1-like isoform X1 [Rhagoletis zephyria]|uniref:endoplasmic reticulum metallopeptidase 1-like isoform X1 n=1 Tax=Rhagoletis zephyria TaxID=28612 RepID=UPI0008118F54|nr:PREDICTED: endoplasmic reticulum metallopeptidase 1-like isoform X1 [Rhagoletis zephyria]XP_017474393.1 PREDICTED: endoplasmic reticulum metallopeptidase 1-like isoform X1 [Rhagoletis zephyria]XP_017474394.1 PREDICTED: endoplasmic reticulum metallopeptidase 1-like isoform X1 [Rhagoletis zephyria]